MAARAEPLHVIEDGDTGDRFLVYMGKDGVQVDLRVKGESFWATQAQMADMFAVTKQDISKHLRNIFKEGELVETSVCQPTVDNCRRRQALPNEAIRPKRLNRGGLSN